MNTKATAQRTPTAGFIYVRSEHKLWTVGAYASGTWEPESDHGSPDAAAARVHYLNGGNPAHDELVAALESAVLKIEDIFAQSDCAGAYCDSFRRGVGEHRDFVDRARAALAKAGAL